MHAARLMQALRKRYAASSIECRFSGIGGDRMQAEGLQSLVPLREINVVGFWEVAKRYGFFKRLLSQCQKILASGHFDAFIPVDYPGFNMRLAAFAKELHIPVCWYIAPQLWAWGESRVEKFRAEIDILLVVFPFEVEFFRNHSINAQFVGHPLMDGEDFTVEPLAPEHRTKTIALFPGSRQQEVERNLTVFMEAASILVRNHQQYNVVVAASSHLDKTVYKSLERCDFSVSLTADSRELLKTSTVGIVKTGTATLEAALAGLPFVMAYKTSAISYYLAKRMITLPHIALANIVAGKGVVKEYIQYDAKPAQIAIAAEQLLTNKSSTTAMLEEFSRIRRILGGAGASAQAAERIVEFLQ